CGIARRNAESQESALKYFLLGAFASGFVAYGIALMYGSTGTLELNAIAQSIAHKQYSDAVLLYLGAGLILAGLGFKVAAVPFHTWMPDVYEGAPTSVTGFMAAATKAAGFAAVARVFLFGLGDLTAVWQPVIAILAALTMIVGNVAALAQSNLKRMLAYSSIAHAGYALAGVAAGGEAGASSVLFYLASYAATVLAAFAIMTVMGAPEREEQSIEAYSGLIRRRPWLAVTMTIAMLSLIGMPPLAGFAGKYFLFEAAVQAGLVWLAVIGALTSVVSAGYYLRVVVVMFMREPDGQVPPMSETGAGRATAIATATALTILIGILPTPLLNAVAQSIQSLPR
ncbi:MAG: NADH-quinone oxidoreductase subunit N, partial [Anaerolineae bacterium]|nr:NADH-quinone oxidoreductase subunit N [Thermoflexales bacterium]MDW8408777.1 NADH-quinone oxidoreductase subunit N [Anaerolineae bacterium]